MGRLDGKVAVITGGGRGIGKGIAQRFVTEGARLAIGQRDAASLAATVDELKMHGEVVGMTLDVSNTESVQAFVDSAVTTFGRIDILVNNAARTGQIGSFLDVTLEQWRSFIDTNLTGAFLMAQGVARHMVKQAIEGRIVNIGSVDSFGSERNASPYAASKGGLWLLTRGMAVDLAAHGIGVNLVAPGPIRVDRTTEKFKSPELLAYRSRVIPMGPYGEVADVAAAVLYLASDECHYVTGSAITVDGGSTAFLPF